MRARPKIEDYKKEASEAFPVKRIYDTKLEKDNYAEWRAQKQVNLYKEALEQWAEEAEKEIKLKQSIIEGNFETMAEYDQQISELEGKIRAIAKLYNMQEKEIKELKEENSTLAKASLSMSAWMAKDVARVIETLANHIHQLEQWAMEAQVSLNAGDYLIAKQKEEISELEGKIRTIAKMYNMREKDIEDIRELLKEVWSNSESTSLQASDELCERVEKIIYTYCMPEGIDTEEKHAQYLKDIGFKH